MLLIYAPQIEISGIHIGNNRKERTLDNGSLNTNICFNFEI